MSDDVREIKSRLDIAEVIGDYVELRRAGASLKGLCPFHSEKTPSFIVSQERQTFHCFGCGKGGDVFSFFMDIEGLSFPEALEQLAARAGVVLEARRPERGASRRRDARAILEEAAAFFGNSLLGEGGAPARAYLKRRNLPEEAWRRFGLGWGPQSWDALSKRLSSAGYPGDEIIASGLALEGNKGIYDRFRGRVIFPVRDEMARITGFGGRLIDGDGAKYINSPECELFNKRKLLYLLDEAKKTIRERRRVILTEGYMDAIRAHLAGFTETVASLGTSLTDEQASLVKRFTDLCYIAYDSDGAGREASIRGMYILQRGGVEVRVISLPEGCDPDDLLLKDGGPETFESLIKKALPLPLYHVFIRRADMRIPGKQRAAREDVLSGLASLPALDVQPHIPKIAEAFGILQHKLEGEIDLRRRSAKNTKSVFYAEGIEEDSSVYINGGENNNGERGAERTTDLECAVCSLLWRDEDLRSGLSAADVVPLLSDEAVINAIAALLSGEPPEALEMRWMALGERKCPERIARGDAILTEGMLGLEHFEKLMKTLGERAIKKRYDQLKQKLLYGEAEKEEIVLYNELAKKLKANTKARTRVS